MTICVLTWLVSDVTHNSLIINSFTVNNGTIVADAFYGNYIVTIVNSITDIVVFNYCFIVVVAQNVITAVCCVIIITSVTTAVTADNVSSALYGFTVTKFNSQLKNKY